MQVHELIDVLLGLPQTADVYIDCAFGKDQQSVKCISKNVFANRVILQDHFTTREPRLITGHDGTVYEVPWP